MRLTVTLASASCFTPTKARGDSAQQGSTIQYRSSPPRKASVLFESIRQEEFDRFLPPHLGLESLMAWQIEWFANKTETTIGTLAAGKMNEGWNYAVLKRDEAGNFQVCKLGADAFSLNDARSEVMWEMASAETSGCEVVPKRNLMEKSQIDGSTVTSHEAAMAQVLHARETRGTPREGVAGGDVT